MSHRKEIDSIIEQVEGWPSADRVALAYQILRDMRRKALAPPPRNTFKDALGIGRGQGPAPTDEEVRQIIRNHRMEKYGG
jgi:hypothetical protein